jgi:hypothetical protein
MFPFEGSQLSDFRRVSRESTSPLRGDVNQSSPWTVFTSKGSIRGIRLIAQH